MERDLAYFVADRAGPGILMLHSFWGLTSSVKKLADRLAGEGFTVLVPDLNFGELPATEEKAVAHLGEASPDRLARVVLSSAALLYEKSGSAPIGIIGFGMGGSLGLWASVRAAEVVAATVSFYGTQQIDFAGSRSSYLVHLAEDDAYVTDDEAVFMEATMGLEELPIEVIRYPGTTHGFAEPEGDSFDSPAFEEAWERTVAFLHERL